MVLVLVTRSSWPTTIRSLAHQSGIISSGHGSRALHCPSIGNCGINLFPLKAFCTVNTILQCPLGNFLKSVFDLKHPCWDWSGVPNDSGIICSLWGNSTKNSGHALLLRHQVLPLIHVLFTHYNIAHCALVYALLLSSQSSRKRLVVLRLYHAHVVIYTTPLLLTHAFLHHLLHHPWLPQNF